MDSLPAETQGNLELKRAFFFFFLSTLYLVIFPYGSDGKEFATSAGDLGSIPGSGRSPGEGNGNPLQYSCMENPINRGRNLEGYRPWGHKQSDTAEQLTLSLSIMN